MGAVQKLATVVIVGMVALSTLLVIYLADEPNRMAAEVVEKEEVAVERGTSTDVFRGPTHPYTAALLRVVPKLPAA